MITLLFRAVTLTGAGDGLMLYITPDWSKLLTSECWIDSATQIFFAYSIGTGALPALGSYNKFYHNCVKDTVITCLVNTATCLLAGTVTFSILGHMAHNQGVPVQEVVNSGPGLVFITYPEVVLKLPGGSIWAIVFFIMLVIIGIDSEFCLVESLVTGIVDMWPETLRPRRKLFTVGLCVVLFTFGLTMTTKGGAYIFQLMDFYGASGIPILWCCFFQTIAIGWIFGVKKFSGCIEQMTGIKPGLYWIVCWAGVAPLVMLVIFLFYVVRWEPVKYGTVEYPPWAHGIGFLMSFSSMMWIPGYAIYYMLTTRGSFKDRLIAGTRPDIKSTRCKLAAKNSDAYLMSESSAKLIKNNFSFLTPNQSFNVNSGS
jgi:solute carrier family 6 GABA transporter-like protein 1